MGKSTSDVDYYAETRWQFADSLTWTRGGHLSQGRHRLQLPGQRLDLEPVLPGSDRVSQPGRAADVHAGGVLVAVSGDGAVLPGHQPDVERGRAGRLGGRHRFSFDHSAYGFFVQDQWTAAPRLTVTYGLRYDFEQYPSRYISETDRNNFQPRIGAAFGTATRGVIRAGYGIFHDRLTSSVGQLFNAHGMVERRLPAERAGAVPDGRAPIQGRFEQRTVGGPAAPAAALTFLTTGQVPAAGVKGLADTLDGAIHTPYSHQASRAGLARGGFRWVASVSYLFVGARDLLGHTGNLNAVQTGTLATGKPILGGRRYPDVGDTVRSNQYRHIRVSRR